MTGLKTRPEPMQGGCHDGDAMMEQVAVASKYGSTSEIAQAISDVLGERDTEVTMAAIGQTITVEDYDAVVAGSAVYAGTG